MRIGVALLVVLLGCANESAPMPASTPPPTSPPPPPSPPPSPPPPPTSPPAVRVLLDGVTATAPRSPKLAAADVERVVGARIAAIRRCYQAAAARDPAVHGRLTVELAVDAAGAAAALVAPAFSVDVDPCVVAALSRIVLPAPGGTGAAFTLAFVLTS